MPVNSLGDMQDRLDDCIVWRRIELSAMRSAIDRSHTEAPDSPLARALARSGVALLYAHWEGFFKDSCQAYLDYVSKRRLRGSELNDAFLLNSLTHLLRRIATGDQVATANLISAFRNPASSRLKVPRQIINTKSNLRHAVAREILGSLGLNDDMIAAKAPLIDRELCDARNSIAHGREAFPTPEEFSALHDVVLDIMDALKTNIMTAASKQEYLSSP